MIYILKKRCENFDLVDAFVFTTTLLLCKNILITGCYYLFVRNDFLNLIICVISSLVYLFSILKKKSNFQFYPNQIVLLCLIVVFWCISYVINGDMFAYSYVRKDLIAFALYCLPALLIIPMVDDIKKMVELFWMYRWVMFVAVLVSTFFMCINGRINGSTSESMAYSMSFGRALIFPTILFFSKWFTSNHICDFVCGIICCMVIFFFGSRFPILCVSFFILWKSFVKIKKNAFCLAFIAFFAAFVYLYWENIMHFINDRLIDFGVNSRAVMLLQHNSFSTDDGRLVIAKQLVSKINESPFLGYGAGGGSIALGNGLAHNFILDTFANFGYIFGTAIILGSFYIFFRKFSNQYDFYKKEFFVLCLSQFLPICLIQLTFWSATYYWYLVAFALSVPLKKKIYIGRV